MRRNTRLSKYKDGLVHDLGPDDLVSRLTDDILVYIVSRLPVKYAVVTGALSRRWRHLWRLTLRLDFEDKERWNKILMQRVGERKKYVKWVNGITRQHNGPNLEEFKICFNLDNYVKPSIDKWIEFAISKNVQKLQLNLMGGVFRSGRNYAFPVGPNATVMEIKFLKALILKHVDVDDEGLMKILTNCPVLEHLSIHGSCELVKPKIHGKGLALKHLEIKSCGGLESVEIRDSNIVSFSCTWSVYISYRLENLEKLEKIFIRNYERKLKPIFYQISCNIPHLQVLELRITRPQEYMEVSMLPKLLKLKQLIVEVYDGDLAMLASMVEACPNLHRLNVKVYWMSATSGLINKAAKHQHLEVLEIDDYYWRKSGLQVAMHFVENSVALKKVVIKPYKQDQSGPAAKLAEENSVTRYHALLEPKATALGVELVIL